MNLLHIDIESYSELDLKKVGAYRYAEDPSTEILMLAWAMNDNPVVHEPLFDVYNGDWETSYEFEAAYDAADFFIAFNAQFERVMLTHHFKTYPDFADIRRWKCAQATALANGLPAKLELASAALGLPGKHAAGYRAMLQICKPRKPTKHNPDTRWTYEKHPQKYHDCLEYCGEDVELEREIWRRCRPMSDSEWELYWLDQEINDRGVAVDTVFASIARGAGDEYKRRLNSEANRLCGLKLSQVAKLAEDFGVESLDKTAIVELLETETDPRRRRVLELRQLYAKASVAKYDAMLRAVCYDERLHGMFQFNGAAATNRWAGRIVQLQNLVRESQSDPHQAMVDLARLDIDEIETLYGPIMGLLSRLIRPTLVADPDKILEVCDYSAIEARVLGWLTGCPFYMNAYAGDGKLYEAMAAVIYGIDVNVVNAVQRFLGKTVVLGCGYQMGEDKFVATAQDQGSEEDEETLRGAHTLFRESVPEIVRYWYDMDLAARLAVKNPGETIQCGKVKFGVRGDWLYMVLPSGRPLCYYQPGLQYDEKFGRWGVTYMGINSYTNQWERLRTYGGKLTENAVQAIARDLLGHAMKTVTAAGREIVLHVHDELVCEVDEPNIGELEQLMCQLPTWAKGLPIAAEGKVMKRYGK